MLSVFSIQFSVHTKCGAKVQKKIHICKYKMHTKRFFCHFGRQIYLLFGHLGSSFAKLSHKNL